MLPLMGAGPSAGGESYAQKVLSYSPIAYWQLNETSGTAAVCSVNAAQNGTFARDVSTMGTITGIGDGNTAPNFNGSSDLVDIDTVTFYTAFSGVVGTVSVWALCDDWTDTSDYRNTFRIYVDADNELRMHHPNTSGRLSWYYEAGGVGESVEKNSVTESGWFHIAMTWDINAGGDGEVKYYYSGVQEGSTDVTLGAFDKGASFTKASIGAYGSPADWWDGGLSNVAFWDSALVVASILDLATV